MRTAANDQEAARIRQNHGRLVNKAEGMVNALLPEVSLLRLAALEFVDEGRTFGLQRVQQRAHRQRLLHAVRLRVWTDTEATGKQRSDHTHTEHEEDADVRCDGEVVKQ